MNVAGDDRISVVQQRGDLVTEKYFNLALFSANQIGVEIDIVNTGEGMDNMTEERTELVDSQDISEGVDPSFIQTVPVHQMVADFVRRIGEEKDNLLTAGCHATQQQREAVAAQNGECDTDGTAAGLCTDIFGNLFDGGIIPLRTGDDGFGHGDDIPVCGSKTSFLPGSLHGVRDDSGYIIALADDRCANAAHDSSYGSHF